MLAYPWYVRFHCKYRGWAQGAGAPAAPCYNTRHFTAKIYLNSVVISFMATSGIFTLG